MWSQKEPKPTAKNTYFTFKMNKTFEDKDSFIVYPICAFLCFFFSYLKVSIGALVVTFAYVESLNVMKYDYVCKTIL